MFLLALIAFGWGTGWPAVKWGLEGFPVFTFRALTCVAGGLTILALLRLSGQRIGFPASALGNMVTGGALNFFCWMLLSALSVHYFSAGSAAVISYTMPLWAMLLSVPVLGERPRRSLWVGLALGMSGVAILAFRGGDAPTVSGAAVALGGAIIWAIGTVFNKRVRWPVPMTVVAGWQLLIGGVFLTLGATTEWQDMGPVSTRAILSTLYIYAVGNTLCFWAWFKIINVVSTSVASLSTLTVPVVAVLSSALVVDEPLGWPQITALVLVIAALTTVVPLPRRAAGERRNGR